MDGWMGTGNREVISTEAVRVFEARKTGWKKGNGILLFWEMGIVTGK